jgi:hypothetical protein
MMPPGRFILLSASENTANIWDIYRKIEKKVVDFAAPL